MHATWHMAHGTCHTGGFPFPFPSRAGMTVSCSELRQGVNHTTTRNGVLRRPLTSPSLSACLPQLPFSANPRAARCEITI